MRVRNPRVALLGQLRISHELAINVTAENATSEDLTWVGGFTSNSFAWLLARGFCSSSSCKSSIGLFKTQFPLKWIWQVGGGKRRGRERKSVCVCPSTHARWKLQAFIASSWKWHAIASSIFCWSHKLTLVQYGVGVGGATKACEAGITEDHLGGKLLHNPFVILHFCQNDLSWQPYLQKAFHSWQ